MLHLREKYITSIGRHSNVSAMNVILIINNIIHVLIIY